MTIRAGLAIALIIAIFSTLLTGPSPLQAQSSPSAADSAPKASHASSASGVPVQPQVLPLAPPFTLTPAEEANLNQFLKDWEIANNGIKTFKCSFTRLEYDPAIAGGNPNQATTVSKGDLKYAAPDKGMFHVKELTNYVPNPKTGQIVEQKGEPTEWWTCDGSSMFEVTVRNNGDKVEKLVVEKPLPPEMRGKTITDGPLPFVFGAKAATLKSRYFMRIITPAVNAQNEVWLEAFPKQQKDAANFSRVNLILKKADLQPAAIQIFNPGANVQNASRTVIMLEDASINNPWAPLQNLFDDFARPNPIGYKHVLEQNLVPPPATTQIPAGDNSQASRVKSAPK
jgi:TIGR03009 family protein